MSSAPPPGAAFPNYELLKDQADAMRTMSDERTFWGSAPHVSLTAPSRHDASGGLEGKGIKVHVYLPSDVSVEEFQSATPPKRGVNVNWHGSGFVYPNHGQNARWCDRTAKRLGIYVVDADYSKAPEYPFPRALEDGTDVLSWVLSQPFYAPSHGLTLSGWSAGGSICLALSTPTLSAKYGLPIDKSRQHFKAAFSIYPATDSTASSIPAKIAGGKDTLPPGTPGITFTKERMQYFFDAYLLAQGGNAEETSKAVLLPEVSPLRASDEQLHIWLETPLTIITCEHDPLEEEAALFARRLQKAAAAAAAAAAGERKADVELLQLKGVGHTWEIRSTHDESKWTPEDAGGYAKRLAYDLIEKKMKTALTL